MPAVEKMQKDFPHELCYTALRDVKSELYPEFQRYTIDSSQSYFLYVEHRHPDHELIYVTQGKYKATLNGRELELEPGDALIICPGDNHLDAVHVGLKYHAVNFVLCSELNIGVSTRLLKAGITAGQQIIKLPPEPFVSLFKDISTEIQSSSPAPKYISSQLSAIFWLLVKHIPDDSLSDQMFQEVAGNSFSSQLNRVISANIFTSNLNVRDLASMLGMSPAKLTGLCSGHLNNSPAKIVLDARISTARRLLSETDMNIKEISNLLHFSDQFTFSRAFKRKTGLAPRDFRKQV